MIGGWVILGLLAAAAFAFLFGYLVMWLWNTLLVDMFNFPVLTYLQAVGILLLCKLLFGGFGHGHRGKRYYRKYRKDRFPYDGPEFFRESFRKYWDKEGRQKFDDYLSRSDSTETAETENEEKE
jgi:hypothetical protein